MCFGHGSIRKRVDFHDFPTHQRVGSCRPTPTFRRWLVRNGAQLSPNVQQFNVGTAKSDEKSIPKCSMGLPFTPLAPPQLIGIYMAVPWVASGYRNPDSRLAPEPLMNGFPLGMCPFRHALDISWILISCYVLPGHLQRRYHHLSSLHT